MSKAYKCDACGKFCSNCYKITGFDIYPDDYAERGYSNVNNKTVISDLCEDCYNDIKSYIHDKIFERAKKAYKGFN